MKRNDLFFTFLLVPLDFVLLMGAALAAYFVRTSPFIAAIRPVLFDLPLGDFFEAYFSAFALIYRRLCREWSLCHQTETECAFRNDDGRHRHFSRHDDRGLFPLF